MIPRQELLASRNNFDEKNDCVVRAISHALEIDYSEAHLMCETKGRKPKHGCWPTVMLGLHAGKKAITIKGRLITKHYRKRAQTIPTFIKKNPIGRFICSKRGHAFTVIDGIVYGQALDNSRIEYYFKVRLPKIKTNDTEK